VVLEEVPGGWCVATALARESPETAAAGGDAYAYTAGSYDALIDAPVLCGALERAGFEAAGVTHGVHVSGGGDLDAARLATDSVAIVEAAAALWGGLPYPRYEMMVLADAGLGGGLEHEDSTVLGCPRFGLRDEDRYRDFLCLVAHEHFHAWNGKRLRPRGLGPFDYTRETWTDCLWAVEGITSYYELIIARRAGVLTAKQLMGKLAKLVGRVSRVPGRRRRSLAEASFDTWTTFYIRDEHTGNRTVSYYDKGALVTWLMDLEIRRRTDGERSFDDALRLLWERFPPERPGYTAQELEAAIDEVAGGGMAALFEVWLRGTEDPDWSAQLAPFGLELMRTEDGERAWLGVEAASTGTTFSTVRAGSPAWQVGVSGGDELVALDGHRVRAADLASRLEAHAPGDRCELTLFRRDRLLTIPVTLGARPKGDLVLRRRSGATPAERARWERWVGEPWGDVPGAENPA
jgi:predicted metalloprotease with PDZ domain